MKKLILPIFLVFVSILLLVVFSPPANAQPKNITCEEWMRIAVSDECRYVNLNTTEKNQIKDLQVYCFTEPAIITDQGSSHDFEINSRPPDYIAAFEWDKCGDGEKGVKSPAASEPSVSKDKKSLFFIPTSLIDSVLNIFKSSPKTVQETQQLETPKQETKSVVQTLDDWIRENHLEYDPTKVEQMERERNERYKKTAQLKEEMFRKAQEVWKVEMIKLQAELQLEPRFEFLWEGQWPGVKAAVFDEESGVIIKSDSWQNIYLQELADQITKKVILQQGEMEVKVINEKPTENKVNVEVDDFFDIFVIQTHFRVEYDPDKKLGVVNVYEGEVDVKTKDGQTIKVKPDGDKPGVVIVTQKLSITKLAILGLILAAVLGGALIVLRRKFSAKGYSKKKK